MRAPRTLVDALDEAARTDTGVWFDDGAADTFRPYAELLDTARRIASALSDHGLGREDLVALILPDSESFLTALFGASMAGVIPASLYPPAATADLDAYLEQTAIVLSTSHARGVVTTSTLAPTIERLRDRCPSLTHVLVYETLDGPLRDAAWRPSLDDVAFVQFTSGSVSLPKGVVITHANLAANIDAINGPAGLATTADDIAVSWLPLNHDMGLVGMALGALYVARPAVLMPPHVFVKRPSAWLRAITRHRGTISFAPNFAFDLCVRRVKDLDGIDLSSWRVAGCGAEPIQAATLTAFAEKFAPVGFRANNLFPSYGLAEHVLAATFPPLGRSLRIDRDGGSVPLVSCGRPLPGHSLQIVGENGRALPERQVGEIVLSGPSVMRGYYGEDSLTAEVLRDGRLWTGDLGYVADGELFVCGRAKDLIIVNGRKYQPQDLEWAVDELVGVRRGRVVAFAVSDSGASDRVVIVVEPSGTTAPDALTGAIRKRIADAFGLHVDDVVCVPGGTIGRTTSGKVQRAATHARYVRGEFTSTT